MSSVLNDIVEEVQRIGDCDHVFLNSYNSKTHKFKAASWKSSLNPGNVSLEQKFMGEGYLSNKPIILPDLSYFNYRLSPTTARLGLMSMVGFPLFGLDGLIGSIECYSKRLGHFTEDKVEYLSVLAKHATLIIENAKQHMFCRRLAIENKFYFEVQNMKQVSVGMLLYQLGESLAELLKADGIAVFGIEEKSEFEILQEVMANGFSMQDISLLKKAITKEFLDRLIQQDETPATPLFVKRTLKNQGNDAEKVIYIVPVSWNLKSQGVIVFYWSRSDQDIELDCLEESVIRIVNFAAYELEKKQIYHKVQRITLTDTLTELANRRLFDYVLIREYDKVKRDNIAMSILLIDIDRFKEINDKYGHLVGDICLHQIGIMMKRYYRSIDLVARYGGEEFAVILPNTDAETAVAVAERFRLEVEATDIVVGEQRVKLTISIGVATCNSQVSYYLSTIALLHAADQALYKAKQEGRNRTVFASQSVD